MTKPAGVGEMDRDLGVAFVPAVAGVLALNPDRADAAPRVPTWTVDGNEIMLARRRAGLMTPEQLAGESRHHRCDRSS
jgi:hypothetical protein